MSTIMNKRSKLLLLALALLIAVILSPLALRADDDDDDDDGGGNSNFEWQGVIDSRPVGTVGVWGIGGDTFTAVASTIIEEEHGPLTVGACAEVKYVSTADQTAVKIESKEPLECNESGGGYVQIYGTLQSFPSGLIGSWVVDGINYTADGSTQFEQENGVFSVGQCVELKYSPSSNTALEIETENSYKCSGSGTPSAYTEVKGILTSFPAALVGNWIVDGITYTADSNTQFEQEDGPYLAGGCVEVKFIGSTNAAIEIGTTESNDCAGGSSNPELKFYGLIETVPAGNIGSWTIGGQIFVSDGTTQLEQENGVFAPSICAEVEYYVSGSDNVTTEIKTEDAYNCNGGSYTNEAYGTINSFPASLFGSWVVDNVTYVASVGSTQFEQDDASFAANVCVKVKYATVDGINHASEIEAKSSDDCGSDPSLPGESKLFATIDSFPATPFIGAWTIGSVPYTATAQTEFKQEDGAFANGVCVQAEYQVIGGINTLSEVETELAYKCQQGDSGVDFSSYGTVEIMPTTADMIGSWQISGISFTTNVATQFSQEHGFLTVGAYVEVHYTTAGGINTATKIETHVAPNSGSDFVVGELESHDGADDWNEWVVDGETIMADPIIQVGNGNQTPQVGQRVMLNTYQVNGVRFATTANFANQTFIPIVSMP
ncbi:hypothetical protein MNBD_CHLOROFLEXI01-4313 [hydrothermal vent metagenome]|uniref:Ig-like domain-containing protein n=1 Tax=hydrothermal vent metagenome TaxID=652676 RepID=A0A3B0UWD4_9ZZZZ